ncbi:putative F-actin-capping protein subunit alpha-like [Capsicum annuum]|nr:putative F-actin-capping protein subunit alpha-like [Capsicum annuum]
MVSLLPGISDSVVAVTFIFGILHLEGGRKYSFAAWYLLTQELLLWCTATTFWHQLAECRGSYFHIWDITLGKWSEIFLCCLVTSIDLIKISASRCTVYTKNVIAVFPRMRERPIADLVDGLKQLDAEVHCFLGTKCPPIQIVSKGGLPGGKACTKASPYEGPFRADSPSWCWAPFEPEGILSSISAILSMVLGVHFGHVLIHMKMVLNAAIPLNKQLYTVSYVCVTSGAAALVFPAFYILVDILNWKYLFLPLEWIGMNAMLVYVMAAAGIFAAFINGWYYEDPHNTLNDDHRHGYNDAEVKLIALLVRHHRRKLPEYGHVVLEK